LQEAAPVDGIAPISRAIRRLSSHHGRHLPCHLT
jgi:hypothetical protein